ncbi:auxin-responsive protein IAA28-like [Salvia splendens]|nr:auxin-responsive protein IAA28-like [Salvia splendens]
MELELGLALPNHNANNNGFKTGNHKEYRPKRLFLEDHMTATGVGGTTLSLLSWSGVAKMEDSVGRPPKYRKPHDDSGHRRLPPTDSSHLIATEQVERKSMHVKVKMEGVAIGRKVDLRDFDSYHDLTKTLMDMFAKYSKIESGEEYTLLYLDKEGDWMLVGDLDWE